MTPAGSKSALIRALSLLCVAVVIGAVAGQLLNRNNDDEAYAAAAEVLAAVEEPGGGWVLDTDAAIEMASGDPEEESTTTEGDVGIVPVDPEKLDGPRTSAVAWVRTVKGTPAARGQACRQFAKWSEGVLADMPGDSYDFDTDSERAKTPDQSVVVRRCMKAWKQTDQPGSVSTGVVGGIQKLDKPVRYNTYMSMQSSAPGSPIRLVIAVAAQPHEA